MLTEKELAELQATKKVAWEKIRKSELNISNYLNGLLDSLNLGVKHTSIEVEYGLGCWKECQDFSSTKQSKFYEVKCGTINFLTKETENTDKPRFDFGSDFHLDITKNHVYINHGCIGDFSGEDIYQIARLRSMLFLLDNEKAIVEKVKELIDLDSLIEFNKALRIENESERELEKLKDQVKTEAATKLLESITPETGLVWVWDDNTIEEKVEVKPGVSRGKIVGRVLVADKNDLFNITKVTKKRVYYTFKYTIQHKNGYDSKEVFIDRLKNHIVMVLTPELETELSNSSAKSVKFNHYYKSDKVERVA